MTQSAANIVFSLLAASTFLWCRDMRALIATSSVARSTVLKARVEVTNKKFDFAWRVRDLLGKWRVGDDNPLPMSFRSYLRWSKKLAHLTLCFTAR